MAVQEKIDWQLIWGTIVTAVNHSFSIHFIILGDYYCCLRRQQWSFIEDNKDHTNNDSHQVYYFDKRRLSHLLDTACMCLDQVNLFNFYLTCFNCWVLSFFLVCWYKNIVFGSTIRTYITTTTSRLLMLMQCSPYSYAVSPVKVKHVFCRHIQH